MRGGGSAKGRADAAARFARWWVGLSGASPERASGATFNVGNSGGWLGILSGYWVHDKFLPIE